MSPFRLLALGEGWHKPTKPYGLLRVDPHGVGVDQFLDYESAKSLFCLDSRNSGFRNFADQLLGLLVLDPIGRVMARLSAGRLVQIVQAVAPVEVLAD